MEEDIKILEDLAETLNKTCENGICEASMSIEKLIKGYRELEKHIAFYEKHGSYKARIIELEDQVEELKNLANNAQWVSPCYVAENYIAIEKVDEKIEKYKKLGNEFYEKFLETNKTDIDIHDAGISCDAKVQVLQELKEG